MVMSEKEQQVWRHVLQLRADGIPEDPEQIALVCDTDAGLVRNLLGRSGEAAKAKEQDEEHVYAPRITPSEATRTRVLETAKRVITGPRQDDYGDAETMHTAIATMWEAYLNANMRVWKPVPGGGWQIGLTAHDAAMMLMLLKVARTTADGYHEDNYVDISGYAALAAEIRETE